MRYAFFLSLGIYILLLGAQCWALDSVHLRQRSALFAAREGPTVQAQAKVVSIPNWAPPSLMGLGVVFVIYSHTIPKWIRDNS